MIIIEYSERMKNMFGNFEEEAR